MRRLALTFALAAFSVLLAAAPAQAGSVTFGDDFETNPYSRWSFEGVGQHHGNFEPTNGIARSGERYANIYIFDGGWSAVRRDVTLTHDSDCTASAWIMAGETTRVNLEIIDPATWGYISLKRATVYQNNYNWQKVYFNTWHTGKTHVVLRMSLIGDGWFSRVKIDDFKLTCYF